MKLLGYLLMTAGLCLGALAATAAYAPPTDLADAELVGLTLNAPAGIARVPDAALVELAKRRPAIVLDVVGALRDRKRGRARIVYGIAIGGSTPAPAASGEGRIVLGDRAGIATLEPDAPPDHDLFLVAEGLSKGQVAALSGKIEPGVPARAGPHRVTIGLGKEIGAPALAQLADEGTAIGFVSAVCLGATLAELERDVESGELLTGTQRVPLAQARDVLSAGMLAALRAGGEERVRVKEFAFGRWSHRWLMICALVGLFAGSMLVRTATRGEIAERARRAAGGEESPAAAMGGIRSAVDALAKELAGPRKATGPLQHILDVLGELQQTHIPAIVQARPALIGTLGLSGFAEFMDRFSLLERQINRAWSAAADGARAEALASLDAVPQLAAAAQEKLYRSV